MSNLEFLDERGHSTLRVDTANAAGRHFVQIVPEEFTLAALDYPILFTKNAETGAFYAGAVMGLEAGTNLLAPRGELAGFRPADLVRQGFFVVDGRIALDPQDPVFIPQGTPLFDENGAATAALRRVQSALHTLSKGLPETVEITMRLVAHRLIEPIDLSFDFDDGTHLQLDGLYSISLDALHALPDAAALELFRNGDLQIAYVQAASVRNLFRLANIRNARAGEPAL